MVETPKVESIKSGEYIVLAINHPEYCSMLQTFKGNRFNVTFSVWGERILFTQRDNQMPYGSPRTKE